jgi:hypothetical protein
MKPSEALIALAFVPAGAALAWWLLTEALFALWTLIWPRLFTYGRVNFNDWMVWMVVTGLVGLAGVAIIAALRHFGA